MSCPTAVPEVFSATVCGERNKFPPIIELGGEGDRVRSGRDELRVRTEREKDTRRGVSLATLLPSMLRLNVKSRSS